MGAASSSEGADENATEMANQMNSKEMTAKPNIPGVSVDSDKKEEHDFTDVANKPRRITDPLCMLLLIVMWVVMTGVGITYGATANPQALWAPTDYKGRLCGVDNGVSDKPYGYIINSNLQMVCLEECYGATQNVTLTDYAYDNMVCLDDNVPDSEKMSYTNYADLFDSGSGNCNFKLGTYSVGYYCIFDPDATIPDNVPTYGGETISSIITGSSESASGYAGQAVQDLFLARNWVFGFGFCVALAIAFVFTRLMATPLLDILVWFCVLITGVALAALAGYSYTTATEWESDETKSDTDTAGMKGLAIFFAICAGFYACLVLCVCSKIQLCIQLTKTAGKAVRDVPLTVFFPLLQLAGLCLFLLPWFYYMTYVNSQGEMVDEMIGDDANSNSTGEVWEFSSDSNTYSAQYYMVFCYFWTSQFITAFGQLVLACTFFMWYFTPDPGVETSKGGEDAAEQGQCAARCCSIQITRGNHLLVKGFWSACKHAGSAAFGSLIIAIIKFIRYVVMQIQKKAAKSNNKVAQAVLCCIQCCLWCIEKCMKYINKQAYIIIAIDGQVGFCGAAIRSFFLVLRNIRLCAAISLVQEFVAILGKLMIVCVTGFLSYLLINENLGDELNSIVVPVIFVMLLAYIVADIFMGIYTMAINVLMQCFLVDKESNDEPFCTRASCPHLDGLDDFINKNAIKDDGEAKQDENQL